MVYTRSPDYLYRRNGIYYFTRNVPSDLKTRFNKNRVVVSLHTRSEVKAQKAAFALSDRLERYFESLRLERFHSQELGLKALQDIKTANSNHFSLSDALALYHRLKGTGKNQLFYDVSNRSIRYLAECLEHNNLSDLEISDAGRFRDYLFARGMSYSSVKRLFSSVKSIVNLAIREQGLTVTNVFSGTFISDDGASRRYQITRCCFASIIFFR